MIEDNLKSIKDIYISRDHSTFIKGLMICLIIFGHNHFFSEVFPAGSFRWLYSFHVAVFFLLPFFYPERVFTWKHTWKNVMRLLWPYTYMFFLLFLTDWMVLKQTLPNAGLWRTYITGDFYTLNKYTGFYYLWFLPAMFSMLIFKEIYYSVGKSLKLVLIFLGIFFFIIAWVFQYERPDNYSKIYVLAGYSIVSFMMGWGMFFFGLVSKWIVKRSQSSVYVLISISVLILSFLSMVVTNATPIYKYVEWIARILNPIACLLLLLTIGSNVEVWKKRKETNAWLIINKIGIVSLPLYLFHQPLNFVICSFFRISTLPLIEKWVISYAAVLILSYFISKLVTSNKLMNRLLLAK